MCFGLGLGCFLAVIEMIPYICLVTVPLLGSFYGKDTIYRLSVLLMIHSAVIEMIPKVMFRIAPILNIILFGILMYLPFSLTPWPLIWLYDKIIWCSDPILMIAEVVLIQNFVMRYSQSAVDEIEADEDSSFRNKAIILLFSSFCYAVSCSLAIDIYSTGTSTQVLCLFVTVCLLIATHNMMWMAHEGIISDCAFCTLCSVTLIYTMALEANQMKSPLQQPHQWDSTRSPESKNSYISLFNSILYMNAASAQRSVQFLKLYFSPFFLSLFAIRIYSIIFIANKVTRNFFQGDDEIELIFISEEDDEKFSPWKSPLLLKISIIFMLTQMSANFLQEWAGLQAAPVLWLASHYQQAWLSEVVVSRLCQVLAVNAFYMWRLYCFDSWTWNPWLTP